MKKQFFPRSEDKTKSTKSDSCQIVGPVEGKVGSWNLPLFTTGFSTIQPLVGDGIFSHQQSLFLEIEPISLSLRTWIWSFLFVSGVRWSICGLCRCKLGDWGGPGAEKSQRTNLSSETQGWSLLERIPGTSDPERIPQVSYSLVYYDTIYSSMMFFETGMYQHGLYSSLLTWPTYLFSPKSAQGVESSSMKLDNLWTDVDLVP